MNEVEDEDIRQYSIEYGDRLLNKKSVPKTTFKIHEYKHQAEIETEQQLRERDSDRNSVIKSRLRMM